MSDNRFLVLISIILFTSTCYASSSDLVVSLESKPVTNVNFYTGNLTNLSQMADVNIPAPTNDQSLAYSSAAKKWIAKTLTAFSKWIPSTSNGYLYNDTTTFYFNETKLNNTIATIANVVQNSTAWNKSGTDVFLASSGDNVGIGTTGPNASLEVINGTTQGGFMVSSDAVGAGDLFIVDESGNVGIGTTSPENDKLAIEYAPEDDNSAHGIFLNYDPHITTTGTYYNYGIWPKSDITLDAGVTNSGASVALFTPIFADGTGTIAELTGTATTFGIKSGTPNITTASGYSITPRFQGGVITNLYGVYITNPSFTGGTVTNYYGIYQEDASADNYFAGNVGIGTTTPTSELQVAGDIFLQNDSDKLFFGQAKDVSVEMNGSSFNILDEVGSIPFYVSGFLKSIFVGDVEVQGDLNVTGKITNSLSHMVGYVTEVHTVASGGTWYNLTFNDSLGDMTGLSFEDNKTIIIQNDGHYTITFGMGFKDSASSPNAHVGMRITNNGTEIIGSYIEQDSSKQNSDIWSEHTTHIELNAGDELNMQYISDDTTVTIDQDDTYASQGFNAYGYIQEIIA